MTPINQIKKATPLLMIALVVACLRLRPKCKQSVRRLTGVTPD